MSTFEIPEGYDDRIRVETSEHGNLVLVTRIPSVSGTSEDGDPEYHFEVVPDEDEDVLLVCRENGEYLTAPDGTEVFDSLMHAYLYLYTASLMVDDDDTTEETS
jgi:hypothetical protein